MALLLMYLFIALSISFLCSFIEAILLSTPLTYLKTRYGKGEKKIGRLIEYKKNIEKPLAAILSLNTVAHTIGAAGVGAEATILFGHEYFGIVSAIMTILILVLTEIVPKTIGTNYYSKFLGFTFFVLKVMIFVTKPFVWFSSLFSRFFSKKDVNYTTSREELSALASIGAEEGVFEDKENKIIQNLFKLKEIKVSEIMTPRVVVVTANSDMLLSDFLKNKDFLRFSRIPIFQDFSENIIGYVFREEVFEKLAEDKFDYRLKNLSRQILTIPDSTTVLQAWETLLNRKEQLALIVDEYGGMDGIITMEDIIETLIGFEIMDEKDQIYDMQQYARDRWKSKQLKFSLLLEKSSKKEDL